MNDPSLQVIDLVTESAETDGGYSDIVVNRLNRHRLRLVVFEGDYPWHHHPRRTRDARRAPLCSALCTDVPPRRLRDW